MNVKPDDDIDEEVRSVVALMRTVLVAQGFVQEVVHCITPELMSSHIRPTDAVDEIIASRVRNSQLVFDPDEPRAAFVEAGVNESTAEYLANVLHAGECVSFEYIRRWVPIWFETAWVRAERRQTE